MDVDVSEIKKYGLSCTGEYLELYPPNFTCIPPPNLSLSVKFLYPPPQLQGLLAQSKLTFSTCTPLDPSLVKIFVPPGGYSSRYSPVARSSKSMSFSNFQVVQLQPVQVQPVQVQPVHVNNACLEQERTQKV
eukprot:scaffold246_cov181-Skeletonema_marinoi.AAC.2